MWLSIPAMDQAQTTLDPTFSNMQLNCIFSLDLTFLLNIFIFHARNPQLEISLCAHTVSSSSKTPVDVTSVIPFRLDEAPSRATEDFVQPFFMTSKLSLMCRITGEHRVLTSYEMRQPTGLQDFCPSFTLYQTQINIKFQIFNMFLFQFGFYS